MGNKGFPKFLFVLLILLSSGLTSSLFTINSQNGAASHIPTNSSLNKVKSDLHKLGSITNQFTPPPSNSNGKLMILSDSSVKFQSEFLPPFKLGNNYLHFIQRYTNQSLFAIQRNPSVKGIIYDKNIDFSNPFNSLNQSLPASPIKNASLASHLLRTIDVWSNYNISGQGIILGITDSGVDFGVTDLSGSLYRTSSGLPSTFDATGSGVTATSLSVSPIQQSGKTFLPTFNKTLSFTRGEQGGSSSSQQIGITVQNIDITGIPVTSKSNVYKVGMMYEPTSFTQVFVYVLVDSKTSGVYDTVYVDLSTSLGLSLSLNGDIFSGGSLYRRLVDWSLTDETPHDSSNPIIARDLNGDGVNDISMGSLTVSIDFNGKVNGGLVRGIDKSGRGMAIMYDAIGHGTQVASAAGSRGKTYYQIYDNFTTPKVESHLNYTLPGSAPNVSIIATKGLTLNDFVLGWLWSAGLEPKIGGGWVVNREHVVNVSSNSWGSGAIGSTLKGLDLFSLLLDALSTPDIFSSVSFGVSYPNYKGIIFTVASGNGGPGFGTVASPGTASLAITVGASTSFHSFNNSGKNDVALFSSNGPTPSGIIKPDLVALGSFGYTLKTVSFGRGNGTRAAGVFGGTSEATPRTAGIAVLVFQALKEKGYPSSLAEVRTRLKSTAKNLGYPSIMQGAGLVDAYRAVSSVMKNNELIIWDTQGAKYIAQKLSPAFQAVFNTPNPGVLNPVADSFIYTYPQNLTKKEVTVQIRFGNGSLVDPNLLNKQIQIFNRTKSTSFTFKTRLSTNDLYVFNELKGVFNNQELLVISSSISNGTYTQLSRYGLSPPEINLVDTGINKTLVDQSFTTAYATQFYSGFPNHDFSGVPAFQLKDPGYVNLIPNWNGLVYQIHAQTFNHTTWGDLSLGVTNKQLNISSSVQINSYELGRLMIQNGSTTNYGHIAILAQHEVGFGKSVKQMKADLNLNSLFEQGQTYAAFNWLSQTARPEAGDYRYYDFKLPSNATQFALQVNWTQTGLLPALYLYNKEGVLVSSSNVAYKGGGFYVVTLSDVKTQTLFINVKSREYTLMIHFVATPFVAGPYTFAVTARYLVPGVLKAPNISFNQNLTNNVSGELKLSSNSYHLANFPELKIKNTSLMVYTGSQRKITSSLSKLDFIKGSGSPEKNFILNFQKGTHGKISLDYFSSKVDLDMYLISINDPAIPNFDLFNQHGSRIGAFNETGYFSIPQSGEYILYIDYVNGAYNNAILPFNITINTISGPQFTNVGTALGFNTSLFPNGNFGLEVTQGMNFPILFTQSFNATFNNHLDFSSQMLSPKNQDVISGNYNVSWSADTRVSGTVLLNNGSLSVIVGFSSTNNFILFDSTLYSNGQYTLKLILTDGVFQHSYSVQISIQNNNPSTLPPIQSTSTQSIPFAGFIILITFVVLVFNRKIRYLRNHN